MDIDLNMGAMVIGDKSHQSTKWDGVREHYKSFDKTAPGTTNGWICSDPNDLYSIISKNRKCKYIDLEFVSADFEAGDICILDLKTFHMTAANTTDNWRISCDTRWLPLDKF
jgi:ectoine hydroxylase-related dioxygenase (phytanoyl-CoA dioxygenase family)